MKTNFNIYLTKEQFNNELEQDITILRYPSKRKRFYVCKKESDNSIINVFIKN